MELDHIAIATENLDEMEKIYRGMGFIFEEEREVVSSQGVITAFASLGMGKGEEKIEFIAPHPAGEGIVAKFLKERGGGIHHLCFRVPDVRRKTEQLIDEGYKLTYPRPVKGSKNCLVNFIHPKSSGGVLLEISTPMELLP